MVPERRAPSARPPRHPSRRRAPGGRRRAPYVAPEGRTLAAGRALLVSLAAFGIWLALDARQLYTSAGASPLGARRSVALAILTPIARVQEFFGLDRVVDGANRALGGRAGVTPGVIALPPATAGHGGGRAKGAASPPTTANSFLQPSAAHPLSVLDVGDSIGIDLGYGLQDLLGTTRSVELQSASVGNTGLANPAYYDWPANLSVELARYHPQVVVALFGGNDWQPFIAEGRRADPGSSFWLQQYTARLRQMVDLVTASGAHLFWVGLPIMSPSSGLAGSVAPSLNAAFAAACSGNPNASYVSIYNLFASPTGSYAQFLPDASGNLVEVRDADGVHIAPPAGDDRAAAAVVRAIESTLHIHL
ncbi:MAG TPA: DUF459 domain-containing protein [Acidimicrobiales bacterium]|nr:DUF459 domain-containing protein [Acidimicrobiales bacterium]